MTPIEKVKDLIRIIDTHYLEGKMPPRVSASRGAITDADIAELERTAKPIHDFRWAWEQATQGRRVRSSASVDDLRLTWTIATAMALATDWYIVEPEKTIAELERDVIEEAMALAPCHTPSKLFAATKALRAARNQP